MDNDTLRENNLGQDIVQLVEWIKKANINAGASKINITSIDNNNGERIRL